MSFVNDLHEALSNQDLVPESERVHYLACSAWYRTRFEIAVSEAVGDYDPDDHRTLSGDYERLEIERNRLEDDLEAKDDELIEAKRDVTRLTNANSDLEEELANVRQQLEGTRDALKIAERVGATQ